MNSKQRNKNRTTSNKLHSIAHELRLSKHICENCGQSGGHWFSLPMTLEEIMQGHQQSGFYSCPVQK